MVGFAFQSLTGRLKTLILRQSIQQLIEQFQSLTGRLKTLENGVGLGWMAKFQSLTGRLKTPSSKETALQVSRVSIPYR